MKIPKNVGLLVHLHVGHHAGNLVSHLVGHKAMLGIEREVAQMHKMQKVI